jgi:acyl carrier protein
MNQAIDTPHATEIVSAALLAIVPDANLDVLDSGADLRDALELDSLDFLAFVEQLGRRSGLRIDEDDYDGLRTMGSCVAFLCDRTAADEAD